MALKVATALPPCARSSFSAEAVVTSAVIGPIATRTRLPTWTTEWTSPVITFRAESAWLDAADRDLPRIDGDADVALAGSVE